MPLHGCNGRGANYNFNLKYRIPDHIPILFKTKEITTLIFLSKSQERCLTSVVLES